MSRDYSVPNCPWCGMASCVSPEHHHEWDTVHMTCGSEIYPPRSTSPSEQSDACKRIAVLASELQATRAELERVRRNHLRRMIQSVGPMLDRHMIAAHTEEEYYRKKRWRNDRAGRLVSACRAALASMETGRG